MKNQNSQRGIAFLIIAIALFVAATLGITALAEYSIRDTQRKADSTRLATVYRAIAGDPSADTFGYLGDVGEYPATLQDLIQDPGVTGWNGPYLSQELFSGSTINDSFGSPMEYFLNLTAGSTDELAIISKGPDHSSSNTAADPNDRTLFAGPDPSTGVTYTNVADNVDNRAYPDFSLSPATALDFENAGTLAYTIVNKDVNQANAIVGACPLMYSVVATSRTRGVSDKITLPYSPGLTHDLPQGLWDVAITSAKAMSPYFSETVGIYSGRTTVHRLRVEDIDSSTTPNFPIFINNATGVLIDIYKGITKIYTKVALGPPAVNIGSDRACATYSAKKNSDNSLIDTWITPWNVSLTKVVSLTHSALTVTNSNAMDLATHRQIQVYGDGILLGTVYQRKAVVFNNIDAGAAIVVKDQTGITNIDSFAMPGAATPKNY